MVVVGTAERPAEQTISSLPPVAVNSKYGWLGRSDVFIMFMEFIVDLKNAHAVHLNAQFGVC